MLVKHTACEAKHNRHHKGRIVGVDFVRPSRPEEGTHLEGRAAIYIAYCHSPNQQHNLKMARHKSGLKRYVYLPKHDDEI